MSENNDFYIKPEEREKYDHIQGMGCPDCGEALVPVEMCVPFLNYSNMKVYCRNCQVLFYISQLIDTRIAKREKVDPIDINVDMELLENLGNVGKIIEKVDPNTKCSIITQYTKE